MDAIHSRKKLKERTIFEMVYGEREFAELETRGGNSGGETRGRSPRFQFGGGRQQAEVFRLSRSFRSFPRFRLDVKPSYRSAGRSQIWNDK
jgi:hypothetical protein